MKSGRLRPSLASIPPESSFLPPPAQPSISFTPSFPPPSSSPFFLFLPLSPPLLFLFHSACTSSSRFLFLPPSLSHIHPPLDSAFVCPLPSNLCLVWQSGGFVVMTTNPGNPATLSLPLSSLPPLRDYTDSPLPSVCHHHDQRPPCPRATRACVRVFARVHPLRGCTHAYKTSECKNERRCVCARRPRLCRLLPPGSSTSSTSCSQAAAPPPNQVWRRVAGARNPAPRRVECACSRNETHHGV